MARSLIAIAALLGLLAAAVPTLAARELKQDIEGDCTVTLGGGLDPLAGHTDLTLSHNCLNGFAQTVKIGGELVNFYRNKNEQCLFSGDTVLLASDQSWCVSMQDEGGFHIAGLLTLNGTDGEKNSGLQTRVECHPSSLSQLSCSWPVIVTPSSDGSLPGIAVIATDVVSG